MTRDPFYQCILTTLSGQLHTDLFEQCSVDLLRDVYPGLVPVRGGSDGGMDGAIADGSGSGFPLICTTGKRVLTNLRGSLRAYRATGGNRDRAVLVTSQELSATQRRNLEVRARHFGVTLVNIHTRADFADRLYRRPDWCRTQLGLSGDPPPLSALPLPGRPTRAVPLVGRGGELAWLRSGTGDLLLVGQPGMGKTALLAELARRGDGLFVTDEDLKRVATGIRQQQPAVLLVEDAHLRIDLLGRLLRLRAEVGNDFRIVADCWPGGAEDVVRALALPSRCVRILEPLPAARIVELVRSCGVHGPNPLLREVVRQAAGRPGLAVTLAHLCVCGDVRQVVFGDALACEVRTTFRRLVGDDAVPLLAAYAVGGGAGMPTAVVARVLDMPASQARRMAAGLAAGGVLTDAGGDCLVVRPEPLRHALVRDIFFEVAVRPPIAGLIDGATDREAVLATLIGARGRGGRVSQSLLTDLLTSGLMSDETWQWYAALGRRESEWALAEQPQRLLALAPVTLQHAPEVTIPRLLEAEAADQNADAEGGPALGVLRDWVTRAVPGEGQRRRHLLDEALRYVREGGRPEVSLGAACVALSPRFGDHQSDPANRLGITLRFGYLNDGELTEVAELWPSFRERLADFAATHWAPLRELVRSWAWPQAPTVRFTRNTRRLMVRVAGRFLRDLARAARGRPAVLHWVLEMARMRHYRLAARLDTDFAALYPFEDFSDFQEAHRYQRAAAEALAARWAGGNPAGVARRLACWDAEMSRESARVWPRQAPDVCRMIAEAGPDPGGWANALIETGAAPDLVAPFLVCDTRQAGRGCWERLMRCLGLPAYSATAVHIALVHPDPPAHLLVEAVRRAAEVPGVLRGLFFQAELPEARVALLLGHEDAAVAVMAALGEWHADPPASVRPGLRQAWREAVLRADNDDNLPPGILAAEPGLARDWLAARFRQGRPPRWWRGPTQEAYASLTNEDRQALLSVVPADALWADEAVARLVGDDLDLFRALLTVGRLRRLHLAPLHGHPDAPGWAAKAILALDAGHSTVTVAGAAWAPSWDCMSISGLNSVYWDDWARRFGALDDSDDPRVRRVGQVGREAAQERADRARQQERHEEIYGDG